MGRMKELFTKTEGKAEAAKVEKRQHSLIQYSDQTKCRICGKVWDTNDEFPPECS